MLAAIPETTTATSMESRVLTHATRLLSHGVGGVEPLLLTLHEARLPGGSAGGGGASRLANEGNVVSLEATAIMERITDEVLHEAAHLHHDGTIGRALAAWVASILQGQSPEALAYAAGRLGSWCVAAERVSTGKFGYEFSQPCPACGETDANEDSDEDNQSSAVFIGLTLVTCTRCGCHWSHQQILKLVGQAQAQLQAA